MKRVEKLWGSEIWVCNLNYCGKILKLNKGFRCSLHFHKLKDETFYVIKGEVLMEINNRKRKMKVGDAQRIKPMERHRFTGIKDAEIIEFSTHHLDTDSYRLETSGKI